MDKQNDFSDPIKFPESKSRITDDVVGSMTKEDEIQPSHGYQPSHTAATTFAGPVSSPSLNLKDGGFADREGPDIGSISGRNKGVVEGDGDNGFQLVIDKKKGKNRRRIHSRVRIDADLETVWSVLTNYEGLSSVVPSLAVSRLLDKRDKFARVYQIGRQHLALGLKFDAKGVIDCHERDLELLPGGGRRRNIDFEMVEGDFELFEGKWSIEQIDYGCKDEKNMEDEFQTALNYVVELKPKLWLPVGLIEGRVCREIKNNILCVRNEAQRIQGLKASKLSA